MYNYFQFSASFLYLEKSSAIYDSTELAIQKMIDASHRMITMRNRGETGGMSPPQKRHLELEIKTLQEAPRDSEKLERLLKANRIQKEEAMDIEDTQRLVTEEIEMLKVVLFLVRIKQQTQPR
jgi:hypothetical protein